MDVPQTSESKDELQNYESIEKQDVPGISKSVCETAESIVEQSDEEELIETHVQPSCLTEHEDIPKEGLSIFGVIFAHHLLIPDVLHESLLLCCDKYA